MKRIVTMSDAIDVMDIAIIHMNNANNKLSEGFQTEAEIVSLLEKAADITKSLETVIDDVTKKVEQLD